MKTAGHVKTTKRAITICLCVAALALAAAGVYALKYWNLLPQKSYTAKDFGIKTLKSDVDKNRNGVDDYTDIMLGAREYVATKPRYISKYYAGGYPPDGEGVCTDVIWKAFKHAGYSLKDLVDEDISKHRNLYPTITIEDKNIDFRRVRNLIVFFRRKAQSLTTNPDDIKEWQPGDIVVFTEHIAIISDKRNSKGQTYIIHNAGQPFFEEDALTRYKIVGHFRWTTKF